MRGFMTKGILQPDRLSFREKAKARKATTNNTEKGMIEMC